MDISLLILNLLGFSLAGLDFLVHIILLIGRAG
jgi:hypothetical protein